MQTTKNATKTCISRTLTLPDGRKMGYIIYGDPEGFPVFAFHGTPGSRLWFKEDDLVARESGIMLIATDRPGFGLSDHQKNRCVLDYPSDVEYLAKFMELDNFSVLGTSGGSIYATACAFALPGVHKAALISGVSEFENGKPPVDMCRENRMSFRMVLRLPFLMKLFMKYGRKTMYKKPEKYITQVQNQVGHLCEPDIEIMKDDQNAAHILMHLKEAFRQGVEGGLTDMKLATEPWGFSPENINVPIEIWHGKEDTLAPIKPMRQLAKRLPSCNLHEIPQKGHFLDADPEMWRQILQSVR